MSTVETPRDSLRPYVSLDHRTQLFAEPIEACREGIPGSELSWTGWTGRWLWYLMVSGYKILAIIRTYQNCRFFSPEHPRAYMSLPQKSSVNRPSLRPQTSSIRFLHAVFFSFDSNANAWIQTSHVGTHFQDLQINVFFLHGSMCFQGFRNH